MSNTNHPHQGRNLKRFRDILGVKQEALAYELGEDWDQKKVSRLEEKEIIPDDLMEQIANILKVPAEAIRNFDEDMAINIISNTFSSHDNSTLNAINPHSIINVNLFDKWLEALDENKKLVEENKRLYQQLISEKDQKILLLESMLQQKQ